MFEDNLEDRDINVLLKVEILSENITHYEELVR